MILPGQRLPIVIACVNRALTGPININADHSDSMGARWRTRWNPLIGSPPTRRVGESGVTRSG